MKNFADKFLWYVYFMVSFGLPFLDVVVKIIEGSSESIEYMAGFLLFYILAVYPSNKYLMKRSGINEKDFDKLNEIFLNFLKVFKTSFSSTDKAKSP